MALNHYWERSLNGTGDVQQPGTSSTLVNTVNFTRAFHTRATFVRGRFFPVVATDVLATNQPVKDFISEAILEFSANFDVSNSGTTSSADTVDDTIVATAILKPQYFPSPTGTADYRVRWTADPAVVETFGQRKANPALSTSPGINGCIKIVDFSGAIPNALNKNIFTNMQVLMEALWAYD